MAPGRSAPTAAPRCIRRTWTSSPPSGARFTRAFACTPVCSPSRMTYLTGVIPSIHGVQDWLHPPDSFGAASQKFLAGHLTYSELIAKAGYTLGMCGKWHMGHDDEPQAGSPTGARCPAAAAPTRTRNSSSTANARKWRATRPISSPISRWSFSTRTRTGPSSFKCPTTRRTRRTTTSPRSTASGTRTRTSAASPTTPLNPCANKGMANLHGKREPSGPTPR